MKQRYRATEAEIRSLNAYLALTRAADAVTARLNKALAADGLTMSQVEVLEALLHAGPTCQRDLGKRMGKTSGNVTMVVDNLEKRGLVIRKKSESDRRFINVELTEDGRSLMLKLFPVHVRRILDEMNVLSNREQEDLRTICRALKSGSKA